MNGKDATNQAAAAFDDTELKCLLLGDENERAEGRRYASATVRLSAYGQAASFHPVVGR